jgi:hypothetical protein
MKYYDGFSMWLDKFLMNEFPSNTVAINFNLYESSENTYDIQLIASDKFDEIDQDWACSEIFSTEENIFSIPRTKDIFDWEDGLIFMKKMVKDYLNKGKYSEKLKRYQAIGVGFVDGDIEILYLKK